MKIIDAMALIDQAYANDFGSSTRRKPDSDGVQAYLLKDGTLVIPGTNQLSDWTKYNLQLWAWKTVKVSGGYRFHSGFLKHANAVLPWARDKNVRRITGHSLGAASAQILAAILNVPAINFAAPKVSLWNYKYRNEKGIINFNRWDDRVTKAPRVGFRHLGRVEVLTPLGVNLGGDHKITRYRELIRDPRYAGLPQLWT